MRFVTPRLSLAATGLAFTLALSGPAFADQAPKVDHSHPTPAPDYPEAAMKAGQKGDVQLSVFVLSDGRPHKVDVVMSSGYPDLDNAAVAAASNYYFLPAVKAGHVSSGWASLKFHFEPPPPDAAATPASAKP
ncbi:MAG TPA: energy transducer TonB [Rhizomicrobium sp.]|nr:energy transducer TonB [Rhizomicrobium sp.]